MWPSLHEYHRPANLAKALRILERSRPRTAPLREIPATPERVWRALRARRDAAPETVAGEQRRPLVLEGSRA